MTDSNALTSINNAALTRLTAGFTALPVKGLNQGAGSLNLASGFVTAGLSSVECRQISITPPILLRYYGAYSIEVSVPVNIGTATLAAHCDAISFLFRATEEVLAGGSLRFIEKTAIDIDGEMRQNKEGRFFTGTVTCPFFYQCFKG